MRLFFWLLIWIATLCMADIDVRYKDGLHIKFNGWYGAIKRWHKRRQS